MAKDPAILFYTQDFLIGSSLLTPLQKGHYITLLCYQQQSETGSLTQEEIKSLMKADFPKHWPVLRKKFKEDENGFFNERMRKEMARRKQNSMNQKEKADKRWQSRGNAVAYPVAMPRSGNAFLETATEIENKGGTGGIRGSVFYDVEAELLKNQIELERIAMAASCSMPLTKSSLHKYHLHLQEKEQYPKTKKALFAGFEKWLMNEKKLDKNGQSKILSTDQWDKDRQRIEEKYK